MEEIVALFSEWIQFAMTYMNVVLPKQIAIPTVIILLSVLFVSYLVYWRCCSKTTNVPNVQTDAEGQASHHKTLAKLAFGIGIALVAWTVQRLITGPTDSTVSTTTTSTQLDQTSLVVTSPTPAPSPVANLESCSDQKMELKDFVLIQHGQSELRLGNLLSEDWIAFWMRVGFTLPQLRARVNYGSTTQQGIQHKLLDIIGKWMGGAYNKKGFRPTYGSLVGLLRGVTLDDLADDVHEAFKDRLDNRIDYSHLLHYDHKAKKIKIVDGLIPKWVEFGMLLGYPVNTAGNNNDCFLHFCSEWLNQSIPKDKRKMYPRTFEGFRQILMSYDQYAEDFATAVEEAGICTFSK